MQVAFLLSPWAMEFVLVLADPAEDRHVRAGLRLRPHPAPGGVELAGGAVPDHRRCGSRRGPRASSTGWARPTTASTTPLPHIPFHRYHRIWELSEGVLTGRASRSAGCSAAPEHIELPRAGLRQPSGRRGWSNAARSAAPASRPSCSRASTSRCRCFTPGSHIDVHLPSGRVRQYSLCNAPGERVPDRGQARGRRPRRFARGPRDAPGRHGRHHQHAPQQLRADPGQPLRAGRRRHRHHAAAVHGPSAVAAGHAVQAARLRPGRRRRALQGRAGDPALRRRDPGPPRRQPRADRAGPAVGASARGRRAPSSTSAARPGSWTGSADRAIDLGWPLDTVHRESFSAPVFDITDRPPLRRRPRPPRHHAPHPRRPADPRRAGPARDPRALGLLPGRVRDVHHPRPRPASPSTATPCSRPPCGRPTPPCACASRERNRSGSSWISKIPA